MLFRSETFDEFAGSSVEDIDVEKVADTGELLGAYVDSVETKLDKDTIKSKLRELYVEAQNLDTV
mgnify:CR=1 FL=1